MGHYLVESYWPKIDHNGRDSIGVVGEPTAPHIKEKIYLHVLPLTDADVKSLATRVDDDGNKQHGRLCLPRDDAWWIAVEGEIAWPKVYAPKIVSKCGTAGGAPKPEPLTSTEIERLTKAGLTGVTAS